MMKIKKRFLSALMAVAMMFSVVPGVMAEGEVDPVIFQAEFDGTDTKENWMAITDADTPNTPVNVETLSTAITSDGILSLESGAFNTNTKGVSIGAYFADGLNVVGKSEIVWETRFKYSASGKTSSDSLGNIGYMFFGHDKNNKTYRIGAAVKNGYFVYGGNGAYASPAVTSNFAMYYDTWYTVRFVMDFTGDSNGMTGYICDDNGNEYQGNKTTNYNGYSITNLWWIRGPLAIGKAVDIDYMRVWDNTMLPEVTATVNGVALDGATEVNTESAEITINFENAVTEEDIAKIKFNSGATLTGAVLSNENKTLTATIAGLQAGTEYKLSIPIIAWNKSKECTFTTAGEPGAPAVVTAKINGVDLDGNIKVPVTDTEVIISFTNAITEEQMNTIEINDDAVLDMTLSEDGKTATVVVSGLIKRRAYTLTIPGMAGNPALTCNFHTEDDPMYMFRAEFDGYDSKENWMTITWDDKPDTTKLDQLNARMSNGVLGFANGDLSSGSGKGVTIGAYYPDGLDVSTQNEMAWETRFKYNFPDLEAGAVLGNIDYMIYGQDKNVSNGKITAQVKGGYFAYGGKGATNDASGVTVSNFVMKDETWYTVRFVMDFEGDDWGMTAYICDDDGHEYQGDKVKYYGNVNPTEIKFLRGPLARNTAVSIDYMRVWDNTMLPEVTATVNGVALDGAKNIAIEGETAIIQFENAITAADMAKISIDKNATLEKTLSADGKTVTAVISGLAKRESYTLTIPGLSMNRNKTCTFATADDAMYIFRAEFDGKDSQEHWMTFNYNDAQNGSTYLDTVMSKVTDGVLKIGSTDFANGTFGAAFAKPENVEGKSEIVWETRFKYDFASKTSADTLPNDDWLFLTQGANSNQRMTAAVKNGCFAYGGIPEKLRNSQQIQYSCLEFWDEG